MSRATPALRNARRSLAVQRWFRGPGPWLAFAALGLVIRVALVFAHDVPRGDVVLDVGVARSVAAGEGFASGFERGFPKLVGEGALPPQDLADQHPPLWPLLGVPGAWLGDAFAGLKLVSLALGALLLVLVGRVAARLLEPVPDARASLPLAAVAVTSMNWLLMDASANGSLYTAQAVLVLLLVECLASPSARGRVLGSGLALGALLLLNHQCAVLVPVVPLALLLGAPAGARGRALAAGVGACAVATGCLGLWWARNAAAFGDPFHSVNPLYFLHRAGVEYVVADEGARMVMRFPHGLTPELLVAACKGFLKPNLLYVMTTGLVALPVVGVLAVAGLPALARVAWRARDRRLAALLLCFAALGAVSVAWPATKLRYLVPLAPVLSVLAARLWAERTPLPWERAGALALALVWLAALGLTADDLLGAGADARPVRWWTLAVVGLVLLVEPLRRRHRELPERHPGLVLAMVVSVPLALVQVGFPPNTAYHSATLTPDFFGQHVEAERADEGRVLGELARVARELGARRVAGPVELLAWPEPRLVEVTRGLPGDMLTDVLDALLDDGAVDHVVLLRSDAPEGLTVFDGRPLLDLQPWLDDRLRLVHFVNLGRATLAHDPFFADGWLFAVRGE